MKKLLLLKSMVILLLLAAQAFAQDRTITGTVTGEDGGLTIPGVSVRVKGARLGTQTDANGKYSIFVPSGFRTIVFSSVGYATK